MKPHTQADGNCAVESTPTSQLWDARTTLMAMRDYLANDPESLKELDGQIERINIALGVGRLSTTEMLKLELTRVRHDYNRLLMVLCAILKRHGSQTIDLGPDLDRSGSAARRSKRMNTNETQSPGSLHPVVGQKVRIKHDILDQANEDHPALLLATGGELATLTRKAERDWDWWCVTDSRPKYPMGIKASEFEVLPNQRSPQRTTTTAQ